MTFARPLLLALAAQGRAGETDTAGGVDAVTPGPGAGEAAGARLPRVSVQPERAALMLGSDTAVGLTIDVSGFPPGSAPVVRVLTNVGSADPPAPGGVPGRFVTRYLPPADRFPQVALIVIEASAADRAARAVLRLPMAAATEMPFRTDPRAQVTLRVADRVFGPVTADATGRLKLPIVVAPGVGIGLARAVDQFGNLNETIVDLQPTPYPRAVILAPPRLEVGTFAPFSVFATEPRGDAAPAQQIQLRPSRGQVHPVETGPDGEARFLYEVPNSVDTVTFEASKSGDPSGSAQVTRALEPGPAHRLTLASTTNWLVLGSGESARLNLAAEDRFGNPVPCRDAILRADGTPLPVIVSPEGESSAMLRVPDRFDGRESVVVEAALGQARAHAEVLLSGGPPARLKLDVSTPTVVADGQRNVEVRVSAFDGNGAPTMVSGISWEVSGGRLGNVRKPRVGTYIAEFIPQRASVPYNQKLAVMASHDLRASAVVHIEPPRPRLVVTARAAFFSNLGSASGPAAFIDAVTPFAGRLEHAAAGISLGYLHDDLTTRSMATGSASSTQSTRIEINQFPLMGIARYRLPLGAAEIHLRGGLGISLASTRLTPPPETGPPALAGAHALAVEGGAEGAFALAPGQLVAGLRYLWIELGRTSHDDDIRGNSAGLIADLGYRLSF